MQCLGQQVGQLLSIICESKLTCHFSHLTELKSGRIPVGVTHRLRACMQGFWKAEECHKFAFPASECILGGILPQDEYHIWILAVRLNELVFGGGRAGWSKEMLLLAQQMIWRHNILTVTEEVQGLTKCHVTFHNLVHLPEDVKCFSTPDNYWCFPFERAVCRYIERSSNKKNIECTYANAESRREFLKFSSHKRHKDSVPLPESGLMCVRSTEAAHELAKAHPTPSAEGIFVGKRVLRTLSEDDQTQLALGEETVASHFRSLFLPSHGYNGMSYRSGEFVLVDGLGDKPQVVLITTVLATSSNNVYLHLIKGERYPYQLNREGEVDRHPFSDGPKVLPSSHVVLVPKSNILRKVILYPDPDHLQDPTFYVLVDYLRPEIPLRPEDVVVPFYPEKGDMVHVCGDIAGSVWTAHIQSVDKAQKICQVYFYTETHPGSKAYSREHHGRGALDTVLWGSILGSANGRWNGRQCLT